MKTAVSSSRPSHSRDSPVHTSQFNNARCKKLIKLEIGGFKEHFAAQQAPRQSRDNLVVAKAWIDTCLAQHIDCQAFRNRTMASKERPTRILEVLGEQDIRLRDNMADISYEYLALSMASSLLDPYMSSTLIRCTGLQATCGVNITTIRSA